MTVRIIACIMGRHSLFSCCIGEVPAPSTGTSVTMGTNELLTPLSAGLEGLSLGDVKTVSTSFQVI